MLVAKTVRKAATFTAGISNISLKISTEAACEAIRVIHENRSKGTMAMTGYCDATPLLLSLPVYYTFL